MALAPLTPLPLDRLCERIVHEWEHRQRIFDLPTGRFWSPEADVDLSFDFMGRAAATPVGPAAGPHSQMAQNIVLAWLGGSRVFELKTVQVLDDLEIARPCIDMQTVGYNIEWSQELQVAQSLEEYVKAWMLVHLLAGWPPLREHLGEDPGPLVFDLSVGYDLAGIRSPKVAGFIDAMGDASAEIERLRPLLPDTFGALDLPIPKRIADTATLSTFHGCPPDEIESITKHLIERHGLDVVVKLNPTLLGFDRVDELVHATLGYEDVALDPAAFAADLQFDRAIGLIGELQDFAAAHGRRLGVKLTNTLVVANHKGWMPDDTMYLSGPPLHVLASALLDRLVGALPGVFGVPGQDGPVQVSFSAGVTRDNVADTVAMGVGPATICSDLLKPGGYGRLAPLLRQLAKDLRAAGVSTLDEWKAHRLEVARGAGHRDAIVAHVVDTTSGAGRAPYHAEGNAKLPRAVDHDLEMFGCVACNFCITVCPNDAFSSLPSLDGMDARQQYVLYDELCNNCGNCLTFCPENGDPAQIKPRLYTDVEAFTAGVGQGFLLPSVTGGPVRARDDDAEAASILDALLAAAKGGPLPAAGG